MAGFTFKLDGLTEVLNNLDDYSNKVQSGVQDELKATAQEIVYEAKMLAPLNTGYLKNNIAVSLDDPYLKTVVSGAEYSAYQEFGTGGAVDVPSGVGIEDLPAYAIQFKGAGIKKLNLSPQPFFFPAVQKNTIEMFGRLRKLVMGQDSDTSNVSVMVPAVWGNSRQDIKTSHVTVVQPQYGKSLKSNK